VNSDSIIEAFAFARSGVLRYANNDMNELTGLKVRKGARASYCKPTVFSWMDS